MRKNLLVGMAVGLVWVALLGGCEWETSDDVSDSWDTTAGWLNFSGVYRAIDSGMLVRIGFTPVRDYDDSSIGSGDGTRMTFGGVLNPTVVAGSVSVVVEGNDGGQRDGQVTLGEGDGFRRSFAGVLARGVVPGSVTVTDGFEAFTDAGTTGGGTNTMSGNLVGDKGGSGSVNYQTGAVSVTFTFEPGVGVEVFATYLTDDRFESFTDSGTGALTGDRGGVGTINYLTGAISVTFVTAPAPGTSIVATYLFDTTPGGQGVQGSTKPIYQFTVLQTGNKLRMVDDNGDVYMGTIAILTTAAGGAQNATESGIAIGQFDADGNSGGQPVHMVGTFLGSFTQPADSGGTGSLINRSLGGTWMEARGQNGNLSAVAADPAAGTTP